MSDEWLKEASKPLRPALVDSSLPNVARVWNWLIGGRDNFEIDRRAARQLIAVSPVMEPMALSCRAFLRKSVTFLAAEAGITQFLDIGTGLPTAGNTHEVAQAVDPACRVVYVDNDPVVLSHVRAMLRSTPEGRTSYLDLDARDTDAIIEGASTALDLAKPVGVIMIDILNLLEDAAEVLSRMIEAVPSGSYVALLQPTRDPRLTPAARRWNQLAATPVFLRDREQMVRWLRDLELVPPGLVPLNEWRPERGDPFCPGGVPVLGAIAKKK